MEHLKVMWSIQHRPSGSWNHGDATLTLYPFEHDALLACANDAFVPIKVYVSLEPPSNLNQLDAQTAFRVADRLVAEINARASALAALLSTHVR